MKNTKKTLSSLAIATIAFMPLEAFAAEQDAMLELRPACLHDLNDSETVFGPIPDVQGYVTLGDDVCPSFFVEDPQTLRTNELQVGDTLTIDIVIDNPSLQPVNHIRSWLSFDPELLQGVTVKVYDEFPSVTPGESSFDSENGYVMIEASNDTDGVNAIRYIRAATVTFTVIGTSPAGTPITFYDVQTNGHTSVTTIENAEDSEILQGPPGSLKVVFASEAENSSSSGSSSSISSEDDEFGSLFGGSSSSSIQSTASSIASVGNSSSSATAERTAFSLLQVRNLKLTTDGSSLYIGWDALNHQNLKAYNVYYGTTSGRYIQRKTVAGDMTSLILRTLPVGEIYYVAIRAVSTNDEESAFSQEESVMIGNPNTSTSPLPVGSINYGPNGVNPIQGNLGSNTYVPGATGTPSTIVWLIIASAIIGTYIAFRRQATVQTTYRNS